MYGIKIFDRFDGRVGVGSTSNFDKHVAEDVVVNAFAQLGVEAEEVRRKRQSRHSVFCVRNSYPCSHCAHIHPVDLFVGRWAVSRAWCHTYGIL